MSHDDMSETSGYVIQWREYGGWGRSKGTVVIGPRQRETDVNGRFKLFHMR